ncbi:DUF2239 family protein, partial [Pseudomonas aeruginosa]|nr:DUF2239 family protein [Pseudomonas aeruginosa]
MANDPYIQSFTCFDGTRRLLTAALPEVALALKQAVAGGAAGPLLVFDNATGRSVDLDIRGSSEDLLARLAGAGERQVRSPRSTTTCACFMPASVPRAARTT